MQQVSLPIIARDNIQPGIWQFTLAANPLTQTGHSGQFYLLRCADPLAAYLRRPLFAAALSDARPPLLQFTLSVHQLSDPGWAWVAGQQVGDTLEVLGPLGRGFQVPAIARNVLLVGQDEGQSLLHHLAFELAGQDHNVALAVEAPSRRRLQPDRPLPPSTELLIATRDGSAGHKGSLFEVLDSLLGWADAVCAVGNRAFLQQLKMRLQEIRLMLSPEFAQGLVIDTPLHFCGVGVCTYCLVRTQTGPRLACSDGPVFDLAELELSDA